MSFFTALYTLLIGPLELFFEILYSQVNRIVNNPGLSIVFLSLAMNFLVLPLYKRADAMQEEERETDKKLSPTVKHIKKVFSGDERFMILQTFYRENNYKPTDALKGSVSLLLEIPFFMAAYNFLSGLPILHGASFGPIANLGVPDGLIVIGGIAINVLPILMTAINLVSSAIYTKDAPLKSKVQLYVMAGLFLVLLYDSPSGLVFYWTLNNLFSLFKNIFMKLPNPKKVFCWMTTVIGAAALVFVVATHPMPTAKSQILLCGLTLMLQLPLVIFYLSERFSRGEEVPLSKKDQKTFWIGGVFMTVLTGLFIPAGVISASPEEFINHTSFTNPMIYILTASLTAAGFFLIWFGIFYMLANDSGKKWMSWGMSALCVIAMVDFMFFGREYGTMSNHLVFDEAPIFAHKLLNLAVILILSGFAAIFWKRKQEVLRFAVLTAMISATVLSSWNLIHIHTVIDSKMEQLEERNKENPQFQLTQNGKNVVVLMMDRGIGAYVPYIMNEKPEIREQFAGFTYYPNTVSFGSYTNFGSPSLFGGYEYTPEEMNRRDQEKLEDKQNEALKVMPVIFSENKFLTTVCDPPEAGYDWIPDLSIYDSYPTIHAYNTMGRVGQTDNSEEKGSVVDQGHKFFAYSLFKSAPVCIAQYLYADGTYNQMGKFNGQTVSSRAEAVGLKDTFVRAYAVLDHLDQITKIESGNENTFLMLTNDTTHEPSLLQVPEYTPSEQIDNTAYEAENRDRFILNGIELKTETPRQMMHYHINMAAFIKLGQWFDYLRENQVFDNTRIIIVSDHGYSQENPLPALQFGEDQTDDVLFYNPLLLVKDFGATEWKTDNTFMTNADTPLLAMDGLISKPVNPFTGRELSNEMKNREPLHIFCSHEFDIEKNNGNTYIPWYWYSVHDDIFDLDNWEYLGVK